MGNSSSSNDDMTGGNQAKVNAVRNTYRQECASAAQKAFKQDAENKMKCSGAVLEEKK
jgi:hypothetical protein